MRFLFISHNEFAQNARLLKAAEFLLKNGCEVVAYSPILGDYDAKTNSNIANSLGVKLLEQDFSKNGWRSYLRWIYVSLMQKFYRIIWNRFKINNLFYLNKTLISNNINGKSNYNFIWVNLIDNLPFAVEFARKNKAKVIYDSQELFTGQYSNLSQHEYAWVFENERLHIGEVSIVLGTTKSMVDVLNDIYKLKESAIVLRNLPSVLMRQDMAVKKDNHFFANKLPLKLVWHGASVSLKSGRGMHVLLDSLSKCTVEFEFYIQGNIGSGQKIILTEYIKKIGIEKSVFFIPPAHPTKIISSIMHYDIGLLGEIPTEENQRHTSSNKLFEYIHAGLMVLGPNLPGIRETIYELDTGMLYEAGNTDELAQLINHIDKNRDIMTNYKSNNFKLGLEELMWEKDFFIVYDKIKKL
jgi:glycosyltransferase involved in cell wall biosynthesis